jgi:oligopeptide transport system substrate-binding protein
MKNMESDGPRGAERLAIIRQAIALLQHDAPWIYGFHPKSYTLGHVWLHNRKPTDVGNNILKYQRIDVAERQRLRQEWNRPVLWPLARGAALLVAVILPAAIGYRRRERGTAR